MDVMTLLVVGAPLGGPAALLLGRWLVLRARVQLVRAAADLPAGVRAEGRDSAGSWVVRPAHPTRRSGRLR